MRILLTNDDGVMAEGIKVLAKELQRNHEVIIVAPDIERSAQSHSITLFKPLVIKKVKLEGIYGKVYSVAGTPADCVRAGIEALAPGLKAPKITIGESSSTRTEQRTQTGTYLGANNVYVGSAGQTTLTSSNIDAQNTVLAGKKVKIGRAHV